MSIHIVLCTIVFCRSVDRRIYEWLCRSAWAGNTAKRHTTIARVPRSEPSNYAVHQCQLGGQLRRPISVPRSQLGRAYRSHDDTPINQDPSHRISKTRTIERWQIPFRSNSAKMEKSNHFRFSRRTKIQGNWSNFEKQRMWSTNHDDGGNVCCNQCVHASTGARKKYVWINDWRSYATEEKWKWICGKR